jgi:hypothetical protein
VLLDLAFFVCPKRAYHIRPEEVPELRVRAHLKLTRPRSCSRVTRAAQRLSGS